MKPWFLLLLLFAWCAPAATEWTAVSSPNFRLLTTAGAGEARRTIEYFEQVRDFFERTRPMPIKSRLPVTIVLFRSMKEFQPYSPSESAGAFYIGDHSRDYIVMSGADEDDRPVAVHEYMHLIMRRQEIDLPPWLNEGIAEVYSTLQPYGKKIAIGMVPKGRAISLNVEKWIPLERFLKVSQSDPEYNRKAHAGAFYAQSWMLVHMMSLSDAYRGRFAEFLGSVAAGASSETALQSIYGKDVAAVDKDLNLYYRSNSLRAALFDTKLEKFSGFQPEPADPFEVELHLARLAGAIGKKEQSTTRLQALMAAHPQRWEVHEAAGSLAARNGDLPAAEAAYRRAVDMKPNDWSLYWNYARLAQRDSSQKEAVLLALQRTIELNGDNVEANIALGEHLTFMERPKEGLEVLKAIRSVTPERATRLFVAQAYARIGLQDLEEARLAALQAKKYSKSANDSANVDRIFDYLQRRREADKKLKDWEEARKSGQPLPLPAAAAASPAATLSKVEGVLRQVDCMVTNARLRIETGRGTVNLFIANPDAITIRNQPGSSVSLTCGAQPASTRVSVEYLDAVDAKNESVGEVRTIEFMGKAAP